MSLLVYNKLKRIISPILIIVKFKLIMKVKVKYEKSGE